MSKTSWRALLLGTLAFVLFTGQDCPSGVSRDLPDCLAYCAGVSNCVACSTLIDCGHGYDRINIHGDWHSCRPRDRSYGRASEENRLACLAFCEANSSLCDLCSDLRYCGPGFEPMEGGHATGWGRNWHACDDGHLDVLRNAISYGTISLPAHTTVP